MNFIIVFIFSAKKEISTNYYSEWANVPQKNKMINNKLFF